MTDLTCDNVAECKSVYPSQGTVSQTETSARVHGWRVWLDTEGVSGNMLWVLCPKCVGYRVRRDPVPERLEGEQPLF